MTPALRSRIIYERNYGKEHGDVFFYIMPSDMGPQRAASNHVHEQLVIVF